MVVCAQTISVSLKFFIHSCLPPNILVPQRRLYWESTNEVRICDVVELSHADGGTIIFLGSLWCRGQLEISIFSMGFCVSCVFSLLIKVALGCGHGFGKCCQMFLVESPGHVVRWICMITLRSVEVAGLNRAAWRNWMLWADINKWSYTWLACVLKLVGNSRDVVQSPLGLWY